MRKIIKLIMLAVVFWAVYCFDASAKINMFPQPRYVPPKLNFYDKNGKAYRLKDFKSDMLMAVLWSRHCGPCINDIKHLSRFVKKVQGKGVRVIIISPEKEWPAKDEQLNFLQKIGAANLEYYVDRKSQFLNGMGVLVTPTVLLINGNNEEAGQITGSVEWDDREVIDYMLQLKTDMKKYLEQRQVSKQSKELQKQKAAKKKY